jgi:carbonic anhydrase/acetyltransferase-like protein (isoleucine patch superfamily)
MVMTGVIIPEGCTVGAKSFVYTKNTLKSWGVYLGSPLEFHKPRNRENVISLSKDPNFIKLK